MIYFFSGTGNSKYIAERIANTIGDKAVSIEVAERKVQLNEDEALGFVAYTAWFQIPPLMREFINNLEVGMSSKNYVYYVASYGSTPGFHGEDARRTLAGKGIILDASYSVKQPDTWTPIFDLSNPAAVARTNEEAEKQITAVIAHIQSHNKGNHTDRRWPYFIKPFTARLLARECQTKHFYVEDTCIGCGLCAKKCPVQAIEIKDKRPVWTKPECTLCFRCLHHCPNFAIQYGNGKTKQHGQYRNPHVNV